MKTYTMEDWSKDGCLNIAVGQQVDNELVWELIDCVPPAYLRKGIFQVGEAKSTDAETHQQLYDTFTKDGDGDNWIYRGECLRGTTEHRRAMEW